MFRDVAVTSAWVFLGSSRRLGLCGVALAQFRRFWVHRNIRAFVGATWAFLGSSRRLGLRGVAVGSNLSVSRTLVPELVRLGHFRFIEAFEPS